MSTTAPLTLDVSGTDRVPFTRLVAVEIRKSYDTRAGLWLVGITIGLALLAEAIALIVVSVKDVSFTYGDFVAAAAFVSSVLLPVLGIMLVTSEWSQRTAMVTFTLEPRRAHVVLAKLIVGLALTAFVIVFALVIGLVCNLLLGAIQGQGPAWHFGWSGFFGFVITQTLSMLGGFALAALLLNTPGAIVLFFVYKWVLPGLFAIGSSLMVWFSHLAPWIDFQAAQGPLFDMSLTGRDWAHLVVSGFVWLVVPLAVGTWRILRAEVK
ncbi:ABC transporter permease [Oryzihumus sp.]